MSDTLLRRLREIERETRRICQSCPPMGEPPLALTDLWRPAELLAMRAGYGIGWR